MTPTLTLEEIKTLILKLPIQEQITLMEDLEERLESLAMMKLAETGFLEWDDPEEDIYNADSSTAINLVTSLSF